VLLGQIYKTAKQQISVLLKILVFRRVGSSRLGQVGVIIGSWGKSRIRLRQDGRENWMWRMSHAVWGVPWAGKVWEQTRPVVVAVDGKRLQPMELL
jgi:hypothetical protein